MALTRPTSHITGDAGERLFCAEIPPSWAPEKQSADYGVDFFVLVPEAHLVTGLRFAAQVKTTTRHPRRDDALRLEIEVHHLEYWLDLETSPVFLIACDLGDRRSYFADVDQILATLPVAWRGQKTVTVSVPSANSVADHERFLVAVREAWTRRMGPQAAILRRQKELQALDPRFLVQISATEHGETRLITAKEEVQFQMRVRGDAREEKMDRLLRGYTVDFDAGEASLEGVPLLEGFNKVGGSIEMAHKANAAVSLVVADGANEVRLSNLPVTVLRAPKALRIESTPASHPIDLRTECRDDDRAGDLIPARATFGLKTATWTGQRILDLTLFDQARAFFRRCSEGALVRIVAHLPGQDIPVGEQRLPEATFTELCELLEILQMARDVSREVGVNPPFPETLMPEQEEEIRRAHALLFGGEYRAPGGRWTMSVTGTWKRNALPKEGDIEMKSKANIPEEFAFLGTTITVNVREVVLTKANLQKAKKVRSGGTRYTFSAPNGEFIQRSDRFPGLER